MMQASEGQESSGSKFGTVDYVVFVFTLVAAVLIGVYTAVKNCRRVTIHDYMLGGNKLHPVAVMLSLLGGWISAVSILGKELFYMLNNVCWEEKNIIPYLLVLPKEPTGDG